jgi:hypothetical protein
MRVNVSVYACDVCVCVSASHAFQLQMRVCG